MSSNALEILDRMYSNPTTVNGFPFNVKCVPEVLTNPVTVAVGEVEVDVAVVVPEPGVDVTEETLEVAPGMH